MLTGQGRRVVEVTRRSCGCCGGRGTIGFEHGTNLGCPVCHDTGSIIEERDVTQEFDALRAERDAAQARVRELGRRYEMP